jgi:ParB family chromosome partitioning protein
MSSNKKLGKGLSSLLGSKAILESENKTNNKNLLLVPIEQIFRDENQPRKEFDKEKLNELSQSIIKNGLIQPLIIRPKNDAGYVIVAGERRWRASQLANLKTIPCLMLPVDLDKDEVSLIENIQREDLKISEEATAYQKLIDKNKYTHEELSKIVGKSRSHITNLLRILTLDEFFFDLLNKGIISMGHARALIGKSPSDFNQVVIDKITTGKISVRDLEDKKINQQTQDANIIQEEKFLSSTLGFKAKISHNNKGKGSIKIFYENLEQYNFLIKKLKN